MGQKIGYAEYGVAGIVAHIHVNHGAVGFRHHTVKRQRQRYPLVVLDAAIVVSVEEGKPVVLVNRVLLQVQTGAVDVGAQDIQARLERLGADVSQNERLAMHASPYFAARFERAALANHILKRFIARSFCLLNGGRKATALGFVVRDVVDIAGSQTVELFKLVGVVVFPCVLAFQENHLSRKLVYRRKG